MRRRNLVLSGFGVATLMLSAGCDSTVGLDPTLTSFNKVIVPGACKAQGDLATIDFSIMLLDGTNALVPDSRLNGENESVGELLDFQSFRFSRAPADLDQPGAEPAVATNANGESRPVGLQPIGLDFVYSGGVDRARDDRLVVMMLDDSASLIGVDPFTGEFDPTKATDPDDQRIAFFRQLISTLNQDYWLSLVSFSGDFANITQEYSQPTLNRDPIIMGLNELQYDQSGTTPLTRALNDTRTRVIEPNPGLNPVVVLFTDGIEDGDPTDTDNGDAFEEAIAGYADRAGAPIPVIVLHLQPPPTVSDRRGRSEKLAELACRTGGEYIFLSNADEFTTNNNLQPAVLNRIVGVWRLAAQSTLSNGSFEPGGWLLSTQIEATLTGRSETFSLQRSTAAGGPASDTRVWFFKE